MLAARSKDKLEDVAKGCRQFSGGLSRVEFILFDAGKEEDRKKLIEKTVEYFGGIDMLILNHTAAVYCPFEDIKNPLEKAREIMEVNYFGFLSLALLALPFLKKSSASFKGRILVISSLAGLIPFNNVHLYSASKAAITKIFECLQVELNRESSQKVFITVASLGMIGTESALRSAPRYSNIAASPQKTASSVLQASLDKRPHIFYPAFVSVFVILYQFIPSLVIRLGKT